MPAHSSMVPAAKAQGDGRILAAFISVTLLFFAWGFVTSLNDPLIAAVKRIFSLNDTEGSLTQFAFFIAYGVISIPAGRLVARSGYGLAIVYGLLAMLLGCLIMPLASRLNGYWIVLVALFVIASGMTVLQVAANPLSAALGPPALSHFRLTLSQFCNSIGTVLGPYLGSKVLLTGGVFAGGAVVVDASVRAESLQKINSAYLLLAAFIALLVIFAWTNRARFSAAAPQSSAQLSAFSAMRSRWALFGAAAIFLYVGAEVSIGSLMTNFLSQANIFDVTPERAGKLTGEFYWGGAAAGRLVGSLLLTRIASTRILATAAACATILCLIVSQTSGELAGTVALSIGFFNSIMFPVIFTMTLERSSAPTAATSGLLCMAIIGGALLPLVYGRVADLVSRNAAYWVPLIAYALIVLFAVRAARAPVLAGDGTPARAPH
jgi:MFS transporter, FHS family, L-fucose permease